MARCSCGLEKDAQSGMCAACDAPDYLSDATSRELGALKSGSYRSLFPEVRESDIHRRTKRQRPKRQRKPFRLREKRITGGNRNIKGWTLAVLLLLFPFLAVSVYNNFFQPSTGVALQRAPGLVEVGVDAVSLFQQVPDRQLPQIVPEERGPHQFLRELFSNEETFFDPCRPIHWVVNPENEPIGSRVQLEQAFDLIQEHTGLLFLFAGESEEAWSLNRSPLNTLYPDVDSPWNPVIVWFLSPFEFDEAKGGWEGAKDVAGFGGPDIARSRGLDRRLVSVTGKVVIDAEWAANTLEAGLPDVLFWVFAHEIGHVVGLDHVDDESHLMHESTVGFEGRLGPGDIEGLAKVGSASCLKPIQYPTKADWFGVG